MTARLIINSGWLERIRSLITEPGMPQRAWHALLHDLDQRAGGAHILAAEAALAFQITGEAAWAQASYAHAHTAAASLATMSGGLTIADHSTYLALAYDWAGRAWTPVERDGIGNALSAAAAFLSTYHWPNLDDDTDKSSNWVAVCRGGELMAYLATGTDSERIPLLVQELCRHLDEGYGETGWAPEGYDYLRYAADTGFVPAVLSGLSVGLEAFERSWQRPGFASLILHTQSLRRDGQRLQFGVGERFGTPTPGFLGTGTAQVQRAYRWLFERTVHDFPAGSVDPIWTLLRWPEVQAQTIDHPAALLDVSEGAFYFRNRFRDADDILLGVTNRHRNHHGWSVPETFALSLIGHNTTWALMPDKQKATHLWSKPLLDGMPEGSAGGGQTFAAQAYPGQGGGFLRLDGHRNYGIREAWREIVIDMRANGTVIALRDRFADDRPHTVDWQLCPEPGVEICCGESEFQFRRDDSWLKGWLLRPQGAQLSVHNGALRITRTGMACDFQLVIAVGRGATPVATIDGSVLTLGESAYDTSNLAAFVPASETEPARNTPILDLVVPVPPLTPGVPAEIRALLTSADLPLQLEVPTGWAVSEPLEDDHTTVVWQITAPPGTALGTYGIRAVARGIARSAMVNMDRLNVAVGKPAQQSTTLGPASRAVDGNTDGMWGHGSVSHTQEEIQPWWQVDLGEPADIAEVVLWNRTDASGERLTDFFVLLSDVPFGSQSLDELLATPHIWRYHHPGIAGPATSIAVGHRGRHLRVQLSGQQPSALQLAEVQVFPTVEQEGTQ